MKIIEKKEVTEVKDIVLYTVCNFCGSEILPHHDFLNIAYTFGYHSDYDGESIDVDICEECLSELMQNLKHGGLEC